MRWTPDLILSTWDQGEYGDVSDMYEYRIGNSGGGFDRLRFEFELNEQKPSNFEAFAEVDIDTSIVLNKRDDGRPNSKFLFPSTLQICLTDQSA